LRGSRGPRQPGGGKQIAGSRHQKRPFRHTSAASHAEGRPRHGKPEHRAHARPAKSANGGRYTERPTRSFADARRRHAPKDKAQDKAQDKTQDGARSETRQRQTPPAALQAPTTVQNVTVSADENGMRVDRFFEARFPGLSFFPHPARHP
jgi:23S rRNA pseudouridine955/2504/2580 synthase